MMGRLIKNIRGVLQPAIFFVPFTYYFVVFAVALLIVNWWLSSFDALPDSSFTDIFHLLIRTGFWFVASLLALAGLTVLIAFGIFASRRKQGAVGFSISDSHSATNAASRPAQTIHISVHPVLKPLLGFIKLRLQYDGKAYSEKFALAETRDDAIISTTYQGDYTWSLPEVKEYHVEKLLLYFEDLFQFFSLAVSLPVGDRFYTSPFAREVQEIHITPRKTEETSVRIPELKKVEGEYLHYKNFENNDDVRRIVWKIYAKNKDLVVRIPEMHDPYASHAFIYASFFSAFQLSGNATAEIFFLNYYKSVVWALYQHLGKEGFDVRYIADQQTPVRYFDDEQQSVQYMISTSNWQQEKSLDEFVDVKQASVVIVSSLSDTATVESMFDNRSGGTLVVLVRLSKCLTRTHFGTFLYWLFVQHEKNDMEVYRASWKLSLLRPRIMQNEKRLEAIFDKHDKVLVI